MALRVAEALCQLHERELYHGRVHPKNVLVGLVDFVEPSLLFGTKCQGAFLRPERKSATDALEPQDDVWDTTALLYDMLTGSAPPAEGFASVEELDSLSLDDTVLRDALFHGLAKEPQQRTQTLNAVKRELARWFIAHAADEPLSLETVSHQPPPLPPSVAPQRRGPRESLTPEPKRASLTPRHSTTAPANATWRRSVPMAVGAAILGITVAWGLSAFRKSEATVVVKDRVVTSHPILPPKASSPIDLAEIPVTGKEQPTGDATASCVRGYLREGTLVKIPQLDPLCKSDGLTVELGTLRRAFATSVGASTSGLPRFDTLGWYALPTLAALRNACCGESVAALELPDVSTDCSDFTPALTELARAVSGGKPLDAPIRRFDDAARCAAKSGRAPGVSPIPPSPLAERAFRDLFNVTTPPVVPSASNSALSDSANAPTANTP
jgi:hypothetical protein